MTFTLSHYDTERIKQTLIGRTVVKVDQHTVKLDNGVTLEFPDTDGGCSCSSGCYDVTELNGIDNVITKVEFVDSPDDDDSERGGFYQIFVFADNQRINLVTYEGTDGNGYYGTGYNIVVRPV